MLWFQLNCTACIAWMGLWCIWVEGVYLASLWFDTYQNVEYHYPMPSYIVTYVCTYIFQAHACYITVVQSCVCTLDEFTVWGDYFTVRWWYSAVKCFEDKSLTSCMTLELSSMLSQALWLCGMACFNWAKHSEKVLQCNEQFWHTHGHQQNL